MDGVAEDRAEPRASPHPLEPPVLTGNPRGRWAANHATHLVRVQLRGVLDLHPHLPQPALYLPVERGDVEGGVAVLSDHGSGRRLHVEEEGMVAVSAVHLPRPRDEAAHGHLAPQQVVGFLRVEQEVHWHVGGGLGH